MVDPTSDQLDPTSMTTIDQVIEHAYTQVAAGPLTWARTGAGRNATVARNRQAIDRLALVPRVMVDVTDVDTTTQLLGAPLALPVFFAPVGSTALFHPNATVEVGAGAAAAGTSVFCGTLTRSSWEEVAATRPGQHFFQLYVQGDDAWVETVVERVQAAGYRGICVTVDGPVHAKRDSVTRGGFDWRLEREGLPENLKELGRDERFKANFTWDKLERLCRSTSLPVILKGVLCSADARLAIEHGAAAVYVSNHGGRNVDGELSTIEALPEIVDTVAGAVPVLVDGGFTHSVDVLKALALGATAVGMGRMQCWGLASGGADGVRHVVELLRSDLAVNLALLGCTQVSQLGREHVRTSFAPAL
jgi:glycolate oxidase